MSLRRTLISTHRWLGLGVALLWVVQAATGIFAVFHWEIDDATVRGTHHESYFPAIERTATTIAASEPGLRVGSIWTSAGFPDRYDVNFESDRPGGGRVVRIDGAGNVLRARNDGENFARGGWVNTLVVLHQSLLSGDRGRWIVGCSGALLLSNLVMGLAVAWPRRGQWRRSLRPSGGSPVARLYSWHRAAGLWLAFLAIPMVCAGVLLAFEQFTERALNPRSVEPLSTTSGELRVGMARAVGTALARYPHAEVSGIGFPKPEHAVWTITLKQPGELRRAYGKTRLLISAIDGSVLADFDAVRAQPRRRFVNHLFPFHTGEMFGTAGRLAVTAIGVWLIVMIVLGIRLFLARRELSVSRPRPGRLRFARSSEGSAPTTLRRDVRQPADLERIDSGEP